MNNLDKCKLAIKKWQDAFNAKDAKGCAEQYTSNCTMVAKPFGEFVGKESIQNFWQKLIDDGFSNVSYSEVNWGPKENGYILKSKWKMNKAFGIVHEEYWQIQQDGSALLEYDEFEVLGEC